MTRKYKRLEELEIWDDFMFGAVMSNKELCKHLLEIILQKKIKDIRYTELQKAINLQYDAKSIRLDVYVEDDTESVYNIEIQTTNEKNLPKRSRYYQGMTSAGSSPFWRMSWGCVCFCAPIKGWS